jgi:hypothetical protein
MVKKNVKSWWPAVPADWMGACPLDHLMIANLGGSLSKPPNRRFDWFDAEFFDRDSSRTCEGVVNVPQRIRFSQQMMRSS